MKAAGDTGVITGISDEESPLAITAPARSGAKLTVNPATTTVVAPSGYYLTSVKNADGTVTYTVNRKSSGGGTTTYSVSTPTPRQRHGDGQPPPARRRTPR